MGYTTYMVLSTVLSGLRNGNLDVLTSESIGAMNSIAMEILDISKQGQTLDKVQLQNLDTLLRICNITYNRTDVTATPIEDGVYDLLLELYKKYNPNYQVGSEVITFTSQQKSEQKEMKNPFVQFTEDEAKRIKEGLFYEDLKQDPSYGVLYPFARNPFMNAGLISKRTHDTESVHPQLVGTLDKSKFVLCSEAEAKGVLNDSNVAVLERDFFAKNIHDGIITPTEKFEMMLELKYDGISVEADCDGYLQSARTRGDTGIGQASDITPILQGYPFPNAAGLKLGPVGVKFEAIMTTEDLYKFNLARGVNYKNCRTAIVGLFGASDGGLFRNYITLVPLEVDRDQVPVKNREQEIEFLNKYYATKGCPLRHAKIYGDYKECLFQIKAFLEEAEVARRYINFMYDGIVVSYIDERIRSKLGRKNHVNKYSMAVKFNTLKRQTRFTGYSFHVGQDGSITPKIHYEPVEFFGTIHPQSTGNSYARFKELNLRLGDIIEVEYVNDVIDRVTGKVNCLENFNNEKVREPEPFADVCPICGSKIVISPTGKSAYCTNAACPGRELARMVNMLSKLNLKDFGEAKVAALEVHSLTEMLNKSYDELLPVLGEAFSAKFIERMNYLKTAAIPDYMIVGALGFSGISTGKWKLVFERMTLNDLWQLYQTNSLHIALTKINGVGDAMVRTIASEMPVFETDIKTIMSMPNIVTTFGKTSGPKVVFTGFRDATFVEFLREKGYDYKENLTKDTDILVIPIAGFTSTKITKAGPNTRVVPQDEFKMELGYV